MDIFLIKQKNAKNLLSVGSSLSIKSFSKSWNLPHAHKSHVTLNARVGTMELDSIKAGTTFPWRYFNRRETEDLKVCHHQTIIQLNRLDQKHSFVLFRFDQSFVLPHGQSRFHQSSERRFVAFDLRPIPDTQTFRSFWSR